MVPSDDLAWSEEAIRDSYLLSNVIPQTLSLNSGKWRVLETAVRKIAASSDFVIVLTGPIFCGTIEYIGANEVAVPCEIFKVALSSRGDELAIFAAILPNGPNPSQPFNEFVTSIEEVQRRTGLQLFGKLLSRLTP